MNANDPTTSIPDALAEEAARRLVRLHSDAVTDAERRDTGREGGFEEGTSGGAREVHGIKMSAGTIRRQAPS